MNLKKENYHINKIYDKNKILDDILDESIKSFSSSVTIYKNNKKILDICNIKDNKFIETYSITKSFCSIAIMFLIQDNLIKDENDLVCKYIKEWSYGKKKDITIKHILTHTSGLDTYWNFDNFMCSEKKFENIVNKKKRKQNVEKISVAINKIRENNIEWHYNDTAIQIIPTLIKKITGIQISEYLNIKLFKPLNITYKWNIDDNGNNYGPNGLMLSTDGLCKVGLLIINNGMWNNKKILNEDLISKMIRQRVNQKQMQKCKMFSNTSFTGYGYLWYKYKNLIIAYGYLGQQLIIDKKRKIVASRLLQAKWDNKNFNKEINKNKIYLNNFKFLIEKI